LRHSDLENFLWRKIDQFGLREETPEFFFAQREIQRCRRKLLPLQPSGVIIERVCSFAICSLKCDTELLVLNTADGGNEIFPKKIRGTFCDLDGKLYKRLGKLFV
jgi:hypothetical protein